MNKEHDSVAFHRKQYQEDNAIGSARERAAAVAMQAKQARAELRDRFAMAALTGLLAAGSMWSGEAADEAWKQADAMLKAREENSQ
jgi:hypothetical protein